MPPGFRETEFTVKENEPFPLALEKVKFWVGLVKAIVTPPCAVVLTFPNRLATKVLAAPPLIPEGRVNVTTRLTGK